MKNNNPLKSQSMIKFGEITSKSVRVEYTKSDVEGYKVTGNAIYNKENKLTEAFGRIITTKETHVANFNIYGEGEYARINLTDCIPSMMVAATEIAQATLADLAATYLNE